MKGFNKTCQGESHILSNKVCQDYSFCESTPKLSIALISDGHGGDRYFRSHIGSELACKVSSELIHTFVNQIPGDFFAGIPFTQYGLNGECNRQPSKKHIEVLRQLGNSIIANWRGKIEDHAKTHPISAEEISTVPKEYCNDLNDKDRLAKVYGCTLIGYVQTPTYWFCFQIGDGKCFSFHKETGPKEPILWDDACFLNKTTSLCDPYASEKFRYSYQGDGNFPYAVFLGSDGLDDTFGEDKNLINFYIKVLRLAYESSIENVKNVLAADLPILSKKGSQDDMSIAVIYNENEAKTAIQNIIEWQLSTTLGELIQNKARIHKFHKERKSLSDVKDSNLKAKIDYDYSVKEIMAAIEHRKSLIERYNSLARELDKNNPKIFEDDIPYEKVIPEHLIKPINNKTEPLSDRKDSEFKQPEVEAKSSSNKKSNIKICVYDKYCDIPNKHSKKLKRKFHKNKNKRKNRR